MPKKPETPAPSPQVVWLVDEFCEDVLYDGNGPEGWEWGRNDHAFTSREIAMAAARNSILSAFDGEEDPECRPWGTSRPEDWQPTWERNQADPLEWTYDEEISGTIWTVRGVPLDT